MLDTNKKVWVCVSCRYTAKEMPTKCPKCSNKLFTYKSLVITK